MIYNCLSNLVDLWQIIYTRKENNNLKSQLFMYCSFVCIIQIGLTFYKFNFRNKLLTLFRNKLLTINKLECYSKELILKKSFKLQKVFHVLQQNKW